MIKIKGIETLPNQRSKRIVMICFQVNGKNSMLLEKKHAFKMKETVHKHLKNIGMNM